MTSKRESKIDGNITSQILSDFTSRQNYPASAIVHKKIGKFSEYTGPVDAQGRANGIGGHEVVDGPNKGAKYEGSYTLDLKHGAGVYTMPNGDQYQGMYEMDRKHGVGIESFVNGDQYYGYYRDGKRDGMGRFVYGNTARKPETLLYHQGVQMDLFQEVLAAETDDAKYVSSRDLQLYLVEEGMILEADLIFSYLIDSNKLKTGLSKALLKELGFSDKEAQKSFRELLEGMVETIQQAKERVRSKDKGSSAKEAEQLQQRQQQRQQYYQQQQQLEQQRIFEGIDQIEQQKRLQQQSTSASAPITTPVTQSKPSPKQTAAAPQQKQDPPQSKPQASSNAKSTSAKPANNTKPASAATAPPSTSKSTAAKPVAAPKPVNTKQATSSASASVVANASTKTSAPSPLLNNSQAANNAEAKIPSPSTTTKAADPAPIGTGADTVATAAATPSHIPYPARLYDWEENHVHQWMTENGLTEFVDAFKHAGIFGLWLVEGITDSDLDEMQISNKLHRKKLRTRLQKLYQTYPAVA